MDYDFIATNRPVNSTAARALQGGEHFESTKKINQVHSETPIPTIPFPGKRFEDITGARFGRMTVIGYKGQQGQRGVWVVRCSCGAYETRRSRAVKNPANKNDCCQHCRETEFRKHHSLYKQGIVK